MINNTVVIESKNGIIILSYTSQFHIMSIKQDTYMSCLYSIATLINNTDIRQVILTSNFKKYVTYLPREK
jgi:hypothetical protein